ncbi:MAG: hypothetical protein M4D80_12710 [Myxococcota bacterium]|nr:hypothetical protein [Myxococcota bacterium]
MKKLSILLACVAMSFTLGAAGCKKKEEKKSETTTEVKTTTTTTGDPVAKPAEGTAPAGDLPTECNDYKAMIEKLASCEKMPQQSRDALKQGYDAMSQGWANVGAMPPEAKKAMADGCKQGTDALKQAAGAMCGW